MSSTITNVDDSRSNTPVNVSDSAQGNGRSEFIDALKAKAHLGARIFFPSGVRIVVNKCIDNSNLNPSMKSFLTLTLTGAQCIFDSHRLSSYTAENYPHTASESTWRWTMRNIGKVASRVLFYCGVLDLTRGCFSLLSWRESRQYNRTASTTRALSNNESVPGNNVLWQVPGNQNISNDDWGVDPEQVEKYFQKLKIRESQIVNFDREHLKIGQVTNGTCSAMSLSLAKEVATNRCIERQSVSCIQDAIRNHLISRKDFRSIQAALNSITVNPEAAQNLGKAEQIGEKVAALAAFFGFELDPRSNIDITGDIPVGIFAARAIKLANNHKRELFGHTIVLFKLRDLCVLYDPNNGGIGLDNTGLGETLKETCKRIMRFWELDDFYVYPLMLAREVDKKLA